MKSIIVTGSSQNLGKVSLVIFHNNEKTLDKNIDNILNVLKIYQNYDSGFHEAMKRNFDYYLHCEVVKQDSGVRISLEEALWTLKHDFLNLDFKEANSFILLNEIGNKLCQI